MAETKSSHAGLTRRSFLKTTGAVAGAAAVGGAVLPTSLGLAEERDSPVQGETKFSGSCRGNCFQGCFLNYVVRDGRVVRTEARDFPDPQYNRICLKGLTLPERIYSDTRIKYPMRRVEGTPRGGGEWERLSWDETFEYIAEKWGGYIKEYGSNSICFSICNGNSGFSMNAYVRLQDVFGFTNLVFFADNALFCGTIDALGFGKNWNANDPSDIPNARCVVLWGSNMTESQIQQWHFVADARENGAKLVVIDPVFTGSAAKADLYVSPRPGSDAALALGMMHIVLEKGWQDEAFLRDNTVAPFLCKEEGGHLRAADIGMDASGIAEADLSKKSIIVAKSETEFGMVDDVDDPLLEGRFEINGIKCATAYTLLLEEIAKYTPEYTSKICDVPVETLYELTEVFCKNSPVFTYQGLGQEHYVNGHYPYIAAATLHMLTGNLGKPGASCGYIRPNDTYNLGKMATSPEASGNVKIEGYTIVSDSKRISISSMQLPEILETHKYGDVEVNLKSMYCYANNFLGVITERETFRKAIDQLELFIVADNHMSETAQYADLVLPVTEWCEYTEVHGRTTLYPFLTLQEKAVDPLYESKCDWDIIRGIGTALGRADAFDMTVEEFLEGSLGSEKWAKINQDKAIYHDYFVKAGYKCVHGEGGVYPTDTGRAQFYIEKSSRGAMKEMDDNPTRDRTGQYLCHWEAPNEAWPDNPLYEKYPLVLYQEHAKWRTHTQFSYQPWLREFDPEPIVKIHPEDAAARGIEDGDIVRVFNDRGYVVVKCVFNEGLRRGMVNIPHGWQADQFIEGHYGDPLNRTVSPWVNNNNYNDVLVEIEKQ